jgi:hypothetical protein
MCTKREEEMSEFKHTGILDNLSHIKGLFSNKKDGGVNNTNIIANNDHMNQDNSISYILYNNLGIRKYVESVTVMIKRSTRRCLIHVTALGV